MTEMVGLRRAIRRERENANNEGKAMSEGWAKKGYGERNKTGKQG